MDDTRYDNEQEDARRLLAPLAGEPAGPARVDVARAIATGRRRRRTRRVVGAGAVAALTALALAGVPVALHAAGGPATLGGPTPGVTGSPTGPPPPSRCEPERLPDPDGAVRSEVIAGDPSGRYLVGSAGLEEGGRQQAVIWDGDVVTAVEMPGSVPRLVDVNSHGVAVGVSHPEGGGPPTAWVYRDGALSALPGGPVPWAALLYINEQGAIVGELAEPAGAPAEDQRVLPAVWRSPTDQPTILPLPGPTWEGSASAAAADGTVIGSGRDTAAVPAETGPFTPSTPLLWRPDGSVETLPLPPADDIGTIHDFAPLAIGDGVIVGRAYRLHHDEDAFGLPFSTPAYAYDLASDSFTALGGGIVRDAYAVNAAGWVAGATPDGELVLWSAETGVLRLPDLNGDPIDEGSYNTLNSISDDGRVVGGAPPIGVFDAVVWHCE